MTRTLTGRIASHGGIGRHLNLTLAFIWSGEPRSTLLGTSGLDPRESICSFNAIWTHLNGAPSTDVPQRFCGTPAIPSQDQVRPTNIHGDFEPYFGLLAANEGKPKNGMTDGIYKLVQKWKLLETFKSISVGILVHRL